MWVIRKIFRAKFFIVFLLILKNCTSFIYSQTIPISTLTVCGTNGTDGTTNINGSINTYFPVQLNSSLAAGGNSISILSVPPKDIYGNNFGQTLISPGDLILIIQNQDAQINYSNSPYYGANNSSLAPDGLGASGYTQLGNSGKYEYVVATNYLPLSGGLLHFKGSGSGGGSVYAYSNVDPSPSRGKSSFQVIRVPQYANLRLSSNISPPPFNGLVGGIIAFEVAGMMDFNGFTVNVSARGFRGGYSLVKVSVANISDLYVTNAADPRGAGKGEGIAGTPRYVYDGFNAVDNLVEGLPGGSCSRGAPANAGGGGNDSNAGGAGGGNGNFGGNGGWGYEVIGGINPAGGRPGSPIFSGPVPDITRLIMGGGGGGGHANDALTGVKGGVGGGIVLINANSISGSGVILANGGNGAPGVYGLHPDGSGGGGAGGTVFIKVLNTSPFANLKIQASGGNGGNTEHDGPTDLVQPHGPGGGGSGGIIYYNIPGGLLASLVNGGLSGHSGGGVGTAHFAGDGLSGLIIPIKLDTLPHYLLESGQICLPELITQMKIANPGTTHNVGDSVQYSVKIFNKASSGNAGNVYSVAQLPPGFTFESATATFTGSAQGAAKLSNFSSGNGVLLGDFNIPAGDTVIITMIVRIGCIASGTYNSSAQAIYLDPTRDFLNPVRVVTPKINSLPGYNIRYNQVIFGDVKGMNYNGNLSSDEDALVSNNLPFVPSPSLVQNPVFICIESSGTSIISNPQTNLLYNWYVMDTSRTPIFTGTQYKPTKITSDTTFYVNAVIKGSCATSNRIQARFKVNPYPNYLGNTGVQKVCLGNTATLVGNSSKLNVNYNWYDALTGGNLIFTGKNFLTPPLNQKSIIYYLELTDNNTGCINPNRVPFSLVINPPLDKPQVSVLNSTVNSITFGWKPVVGADVYQVSLDSGKTYIVPSSGSQGLTQQINGLNFNTTQTILVKAISNLEGCPLNSISNLSMATTLVPNPNLIFVPNAFTPNGDGINDIVYVHSEGIATILFQVYDQWGELLFISNSLNKGWDGFYKGNKEPAGVYIYYLKATMIQGPDIIKKGTITLLR